MIVSAGPLTEKADLHRLRRNERAMIRWLCGVKSGDNTSTAELIQKLDISDIGATTSRGHLRWFVHIKGGDTWTARVFVLGIDGRILRGIPRKTWAEDNKSDFRENCLNPSDVLDRVYVEVKEHCSVTPVLRLMILMIRKRKSRSRTEEPSFFVHLTSFLFRDSGN